MSIDASLTSPRGPSRRRVLQILAASAAVPVGVAGLRLFGPQPVFHAWHGQALGAQASMQLWHANAGHAQRTLARMASEVLRLERVFSLYQPESEISRLNRDGIVSEASRDMTRVLEAARTIAEASDGAFDPTVQPLWTLNERHFADGAADPTGPAPALLESTRTLVDYRQIEIAQGSVRLAMPGMALTLNGIAQGYITDVVADLLRNEGFDHVVVELGETRVLGSHPDGRPWLVGVRDASGAVGQTIELVNESSATSGGYGTMFDASGLHHHIFDPETGLSSNRLREVTVTSPRAMDADALATALLVAGEDKAAAMLATTQGARALITRNDSSTVLLG
jgi:thiamine biosynthesis lipoprotein